MLAPNIQYLLYLKKDAGRTAKLSELTELEAKERLLALQDKGEGISADAGMERLIENVVESAQRL